MSPSWLGLRAFEATARHGSFKAAADELRLTPSAVSHRIARLESQLNVKLFQRHNRGFDLTDAGRRYLGSIQDAFLRIDIATRHIVRPKGIDRLNIHSTPSFASLWLMPRLRRFIAENPNVDVRVGASPTAANFISDDVHIDIRYGDPDWHGMEVRPFGIETISPLCSPDLRVGARRLREPHDLARVTLIHSEVGTVQWSDWLRLHRIGGIDLEHGLRFDRTLMTLQAAVDGLGVALDSESMAAGELASGRLIRPFADLSGIEVVVHHLVFPPTHARLPHVRRFVAWITREIEDEARHRRRVPAHGR